jgi:hypothetical protein
LDGDDKLVEMSQVAVQPEWSAQGILPFVSDRSGWWNLYRERDARVESLLAMAAEFADAPWELDYSSYASWLMDASPVATGSTAGIGLACSIQNPVGSRIFRFRTPRSSRIFGRWRIAWRSSAPVPRPARPWRPSICQLVASMFPPGPRFPLLRPGSRCPSQSSPSPGRPDGPRALLPTDQP